MTTTVFPIVIIAPKQLENTQTTQYTSTSVKTLIDKATLTNTTASAVTVSVNLVTSGDTAADSNLVLDEKTILPGETYRCPELVGQLLGEGDFISTLAGTASAVTARFSGRQIST